MPREKRFLLANRKSFINTEISKAIITRTNLRNCFLKKKESDENRPLFCNQRNKCVSLARKVKRDYFTGLRDKYIGENKCFWKTVKPFWSNKAQFSERIKLAEEDDFLATNEEEAAMKLNDFFSNAVNLKLRSLRILIICQKT